MTDVQTKALMLASLLTSPTKKDKDVFDLVMEYAKERCKEGSQSWPFMVRADDVLKAIGEVYK